MRVSRKWLNEYVGITLPDDTLAERLTMAGLEVESVESHAEKLRGIVVGEVRSCEKHQNANKLTVCRVFDGKSDIQVICGAPNVGVGQKVAFAPSGTTIPRNQHDPDGQPLLLRSIKIRGVLSEGMICSGYELGISEESEGILVLDPGARAGRPITDHLGLDDSIFEIGVTANRPDLLSHIGVAREIAALTRKKLIFPKVFPREGVQSISSVLSVTLEDSANCPRYSARVLFGVSPGASPDWMQKYLTSVNIRPVNNIVDITNYVLMETGQPLHAFDYDKINNGEIVVRCPRDEKTLVTLDGKRRDLAKDTLLICDGSGPVAIGGVMGGRNSEITESTKRIVVESAYFNPVSIRKTSKRLGISTEASQRFERGADPDITVRALDRAADLMQKFTGGTILKGRIDRYPRKIKPKSIPFNVDNSNKLLDVTLNEKTASALLKRIGINRKPGKTKTAPSYLAPTWRPDITREIDLVEEVARLYGYDKIKTVNRVRFSLRESAPPPDMTDLFRTYLSASGYHEIVTNSMQDTTTAGSAGDLFVEISNPISNEMAALRTQLLPGMLNTIKHNISHGTSSSRFYELGLVFSRLPGEDSDSLSGYREEERLIVGMYGLESPRFWGKNEENMDVFTLKGEANALFRQISLDNARYIPYPTPSALTERSIFIEINGEKAGLLGLVSRKLLNRYDMETDVFFLDLSIDVIRKHYPRDVRYRSFSRYPTVSRDLAVIVDDAVQAGLIEKEIRLAAGPLLSGITLFDIYRGDQIGAGKKSCAFSMEFTSIDHTLEHVEIQGVIEKVTGRLVKSFNAVLRQ